ncbi:hypothetical protein BDF19DRAFT_211550 [Syncephalis fuscata]|nr:hypothetical protein BDF19DRAFT_211550 [Syncephalis fuscata]
MNCQEREPTRFKIVWTDLIQALVSLNLKTTKLLLTITDTTIAAIPLLFLLQVLLLLLLLQILLLQLLYYCSCLGHNITCIAPHSFYIFIPITGLLCLLFLASQFNYSSIPTMTILSNVFSPSGPISNAIETATTVTASREEDWQLIIDICNLVNSRPEGPKEAAKAVRKRIKTKQVGTQLLTITLMQSLFDNCGAKYRVAISNSKFTETLAKLMSRSDTDPEVRSKLYVALTSWAEQLRGEPGMEAIPALYDNLNTITTLTPSDDNNNDNMRSSHLEAMSPEKMQKEVPRLVEICHNSVEMLSESLVYTDPDTEDIRKNEFIQEFYVKCKNLQTEVGRFIASAQDEQLIDQLLKANQELLDVFQQYDEIVERHDIVSATNRSAADMAQFSSATSSSPSTNPPNSNGHEYAKQSSSNPFNDQHHQLAFHPLLWENNLKSSLVLVSQVLSLIVWRHHHSHCKQWVHKTHLTTF